MDRTTELKVKMMLTCKMDQMEVRDKVQDMTDSVLVLGMGLKLFFYRYFKGHVHCSSSVS